MRCRFASERGRPGRARRRKPGSSITPTGPATVISETFQLKKEADARAAKVKVDVGAGVHVAPDQEMTVVEAAENWIKRVEAEGRERSTVRQYRQHIDLHIVPRIGKLKLAKLTPKRR